MRLTINLDDDLYAVAKSLARADDCSVSAALNKLVRRALEPRRAPPRARRDELPVVHCTRTFTSEDVEAKDAEQP